MPDNPREATLRHCVEEVARQLTEANLWFGHGTDNAWDEAVWLVMCAADITISENVIDWQQTLSTAQGCAVTNLANQRITSRQPLAYLVGHAWFAGYRFDVDSRVIVPRSHLGEWIVEQLQPWLDPASVMEALDLCTGSGCIAIALALEFPEATIDATDLSAAALVVANQNVQRHGVSDRVHLFEGDLLEPISDRCYNLIVCNPPYVDATTMTMLPDEYQHEPAIAFAGGEDGLAIVRRLLADVEPRLMAGGSLLVEVGAAASGVELAWPTVPFTWLVSDDGDPVIFLLSKEELRLHQHKFTKC